MVELVQVILVMMVQRGLQNQINRNKVGKKGLLFKIGDFYCAKSISIILHKNFCEKVLRYSAQRCPMKQWKWKSVKVTRKDLISVTLLWKLRILGKSESSSSRRSITSLGQDTVYNMFISQRRHSQTLSLTATTSHPTSFKSPTTFLKNSYVA